MLLTDIVEKMNEALAIIYFFKTLKWFVIIGGAILIIYFIVASACKNQIKKNKETIDYDYLAQKTADEVCKRIAIINNMRSQANNNATHSAGDQQQITRTGASEQNGSRQA